MITVRHPSKNLVVEATVEFCVECEQCEIDIDLGDIGDIPKIITDISVMFFCNLKCLYKWAIEENEKLKESGKEI